MTFNINLWNPWWLEMIPGEVDFSSVSQIYSNSFAFLLVDDANLPQCWGRSGYGGAWWMNIHDEHP